MRGWIGVAATLAVGVAALVYFAAATEDAYERLTEELLPGMQWGALEPGLEGYVRANERGGRFIDDATRERGEALAELAAEAVLVDDDNLYLRWRKIEDRATGAKNALFDQLADLRKRNGLPDSDRILTDEEWEALSPREYALELFTGLSAWRTTSRVMTCWIGGLRNMRARMRGTTSCGTRISRCGCRCRSTICWATPPR